MEDTHHNINNEVPDERSGMQMLSEIGRLLLLLLLSFSKFLLRLLRKGLRFLLKWFFKGVLALIDLAVLAVERSRAFWNDNDTQAKVRKLRLWSIRAARASWLATKRALRASGRGLVWLGVHAWTGLCWLGQHAWLGFVWLLVHGFRAFIWLVKASAKAVIHLNTTLKSVGRGSVRAAKGIWRGLKHGWVCMGQWLRRRRDAYRTFRREKGFKGLLNDMVNWLKRQINNYIEETPAADETDDEIDDAENPFHADGDQNKMHTFGRGIYNAMRRIVED